MFEIRRYDAAGAAEWNAFVAGSKNGTFLFDRNYMDYHADRFADRSLMIYRDGALMALLPGNAAPDGLFCSHGGLTYGGLITGCDATAAAVTALFGELNEWLKANGFSRVRYKAVPWIYHRVPAEEDLYAIFRCCDARLVARDISSAIVMQQPLRWSHSRRCGVGRARNRGITVETSDRIDEFWSVLEGNLSRRYGAHPVHTAAEMKLLMSRFPRNIRLYVACRGGEVLGGTVIYITGQVVHAQYISACEEGKRLGAIDAIYDRVLNHDFTDYKYFDFGKSTEDGGRRLNESLIFQKEGFGGRGVCYDTYEWTL